MNLIRLRPQSTLMLEKIPIIQSTTLISIHSRVDLKNEKIMLMPMMDVFEHTRLCLRYLQPMMVFSLPL